MNDVQGLSDPVAGGIFDVLVDYCGASEDMRSMFVAAQSHGLCHEFRFQGSLGFGGKFWREANADGTESWTVNAYKEDITPETAKIIDTANAVLHDLNRRISSLAK